MVNPRDLVEAIVAKLRDIPELVTEMENDPDRIRAYHDRFPDQMELGLAVSTMQPPAMLVYWRGSRFGVSGTLGPFTHDFSIVLRAKVEESDVELPEGYYRLWERIVNGVPAGGPAGLALVNQQITSDVLPMDAPSIGRRQLLLTDNTRLEYFEVTFSLSEG